MPANDKKERLRAFYRDLCLSFVGSLRALSLYPPDHPEPRKKVDDLFRRLSRYLDQKASMTLLFLHGEVVVENMPLHELRDTLARIIQRFEAMKLQRFLFHRGLKSAELMQFLVLLLPLLKDPDGADLVLARNQERMPHIQAGALPLEAGEQTSYEEVSDALKAARKSVISLYAQRKDLFTGVRGPLSEEKVSLAKEIVNTIRDMMDGGQMPLIILIYRRSADPDPFIHAINVSALSMAVAQEVEPKESIVLEVGLGALLHDIGLHLPLSVSLTDTQALTLDERKRYWEHPVRGAEVLLASPGMPDLVPLVAYEHHIHYDGSGYPKQERSRDLNMASLITCITNTYDNLRRNRPGRRGISLSDSLNWMDRQSGTRFHPLLYKRFRALVKAQAQEGM